MLYDWTKPAATLEAIKTKILTSMNVELKWYVRYRKRHAIFSRGIRVVAIFLFFAGILLPIINYDIVTFKWGEAKSDPVNIGYIGLAIGSLLLLLDKYLGVSSGYVRFFLAELEINKSTHEFESNWNIEAAKSSNPMTVENIVSLLNVIKQFHQAVYAIIHVETSAWATEFQSQTSELNELFRQKQNEATKPVNIMVAIENHKLYPTIEVGIDYEPLININGDSTIIFKNVSIEPHILRIKASNAQNQNVSFSKNVDVQKGANVEVTLTLPINAEG